MENKKKNLWLAACGIGVLVVLLFVFGHRAAPRASSVPVAIPEGLPGIQTTTGPWVAELSHLRERLNDIGLPALSFEGTALHIHQHIDIFIDGQPAKVPADIGVNPLGLFISPLHVHDDSGIIHVESPTVQTFTLGQFFDVWGVVFTNDSIGGYRAGNGKALKVFVNGVPYAGDFRALALASHQEIVVAYGTDAELPNPMPASYPFPDGY